MDKTMQFRGEQSASLGPKVAITAWYLLCAVAATLLVLVVAEASAGDAGRRIALLTCVLIYIARAAYTLFAFVRRTIPWWEAAWGGSILGLVLFFFLHAGLRATEPLGPLDAAGLLAYAAGSWLGTASEQARHRWKTVPEHQGHLYTLGLFRLSRHVNYFGDLLLFAGLAILTQQPWAAAVPLMMGLNFALVIIPAHDAYLAKRYGTEFSRYAERTRKLIPLLY